MARSLIVIADHLHVVDSAGVRTLRVTSASWPLVGRAALVDEVASTLFGDHGGTEPGGAGGGGSGGGSNIGGGGCGGRGDRDGNGDEPPVGAVVLVGQRGIGKTRIARAVSRARIAAGATAVWLSGSSPATDVPWGAIRHLVPGAVDGSPEEQRERAGRVLTAGGAEALLIVDDIHLVDHATLDLVTDLVAQGRIRLLATRAGAPEPDWAGGRWRIRTVAPLGIDAVAELLTRTLGGEVTPGTVRALTDASRGNPAVLGDVIERSLADGSLEPVGRWWEWHEDSQRGAEALAERLRGVSSAVRQVLEVVAMAEESAGPELVIGAAARAGATADDDATNIDWQADAVVAPVAAALEDAHRLGLVRTVTTGHRRIVVLTQPSARHMIREASGDLATRRAALAVADAVAGFGGRRAGDALRIARSRVEATGTAPRGQLINACHIAARAGDIDSLERLAWAALRDGPDPVAAVLLAETLIAHGRFAEANGLLSSAESALDRPTPSHAVTGTADLDHDAILVRVGLARATMTGSVHLRHGEASEALADIEQRVCDRPGLRAMLRSARVIHELWRGGPRAALPLMSAAGVGEPGARALALALAGRSRDALTAAAAWETTSTWAGIASALASLDLGDRDRAAATAADGYAQAGVAGAASSRTWFALVQGRIALRSAEPATAAPFYGEAAVLADEYGLPGEAALAAAGAALSGGEPLREHMIGDGPFLLIAEPVLARSASLRRTSDTDQVDAILAAGYRLAMERGAVADAAWITAEREGSTPGGR